jgi:thiamine-phosphate pyrophosphorylase
LPSDSFSGDSPFASFAAFAGLHVLVDDDPRWRLDPVEQARAACAGGAHVVQLRSKRSTDRDTLDWAHAIRGLTRASGATFVVNDRVDLALLAEADAVHLGQDDLDPRAAIEAAEAAGRALAVGRSTHTLEQARAACEEPVDYVAFGPLFGTSSKDSTYTARGLETLAEVVRAVAPRTAVAIGGIDAQNLGSVLGAGAGGAAVISAVAASTNPTRSTHELVACFPGAVPGARRAGHTK